ncbi:MAG: ATP-binding cassette domain-containing protein [Desulfurococcales archaeon]|nr:ATP-binding cassette domain-containing protein [Desulfurococcales archaeon]
MDWVIEARNLVVGAGGTPISGPATLRASRGEIVVIAGPNGAGKTSLLRALAGLADHVEGYYHIRGTPAYIPQSDMLLPWKTLGDNIAFPLLVRGTPRREAWRRVEGVAGLLGLKPHLSKYPREASGGTRRKASVARGLVVGADVLLLDEPFAGLDVAAKGALLEGLRRLAGEGITMVLVTHDLLLASRIADRILVLLPPPRGLSAEYSLRGLGKAERYGVAEEVVELITREGGF